MDTVIDIDKDILLAEWSQKSPSMEQKMHELGGTFEDHNVYRFPLDLTTLREINRIARRSGKVTLSKRARVTIIDMKRDLDTAKELSGGDADADIPAELLATYPATARSLRPYQRAAVEFMRSRNSVLLADHPGAGKTVSTISSIVAAGVTGDILVLAPSIAVQAAWPQELERWAPKDEVVRVIGGRAKREAALKKLFFKPKADRRWILCNIEMAKVTYRKEAIREDGTVAKSRYDYSYPELFFYDEKTKKKKREWSAIIVDESHRALVTDKSQHYKQTQTRCGLSKLAVKEDGYRYALSGTPFRGKLENMWGTLNWLFPKKYTSYWDWIERWFDTSSGYFGGTKVTEIKSGQSGAFYESLATFTLRRTKAEIAPDLPPKMYAGHAPAGLDYEPGEERGLVGHWLEMGPKQKRAYEQMVETATANLDNGTLVANGVLAELTRLKQFASCYGRLDIVEDSDGFEVPKFVPELPSNKFDWLLEFLEELGIIKGSVASSPEDQKVIVASQFTSVIDLYAEALEKKGIKTLRITGKVNRADREKAVAEFQTDRGAQVLLLNTIAGGVALTLDRADDLVILDETFIPDDQEQVEDRIHRVSRVHNVTIHYVRSLGTIEERIARVTFGRDELQKQLLDGERGVDFARQILG